MAVEQKETRKGREGKERGGEETRRRPISSRRPS